MLKIKDLVDLKELELFGFDRPKYSEDTGEKIRIEYSRGTNWGWLYVDISTRKIISGCKNNEGVEIYYQPQLDIIYNLIQAGLVEKV